jgi:hypothetical protein
MAETQAKPDSLDAVVLNFGHSDYCATDPDEIITIPRIGKLDELDKDLTGCAPTRDMLWPEKSGECYQVVKTYKPRGSTIHLLWEERRHEWVALVYFMWQEDVLRGCDWNWSGPYALNASAKEKLREAYGLEEQCDNIEHQGPPTLESVAQQQRLFTFSMGNEQLRIVNLKQILRVRGKGLDMAIDIPAPGRYDTTGWRQPARIFQVDVTCRLHSSSAQEATINVRSHESGLRYAPAGDSAHDGYSGYNFDNYYDDWIFVKKDGDKLTAQVQIPVPHDT